MQHTVGDSTKEAKTIQAGIQLFGMCVVVGYASYSDCNETLQVQQYVSKNASVEAQ